MNIQNARLVLMGGLTALEIDGMAGLSLSRANRARQWRSSSPGSRDVCELRQFISASQYLSVTRVWAQVEQDASWSSAGLQKPLRSPPSEAVVF